jgi:hypothetical protein
MHDDAFVLWGPYSTHKAYLLELYLAHFVHHKIIIKNIPSKISFSIEENKFTRFFGIKKIQLCGEYFITISTHLKKKGVLGQVFLSFLQFG